MVESIIGLIVLVIFTMLFMGIINPRWGTFGLKPNWSRLKVSGMYIVLLVIISCLAYLVEEPGEQMTSNTTRNSRLTLKKEDFKEYAAKSRLSEKELEIGLDNLSKIGLDENRIEKITERGIELKTFEGEVELGRPTIITFGQYTVIANLHGATVPLLKDGKIFYEINDIYLKRSVLKKVINELEEKINKEVEKSKKIEPGYKVSEIIIGDNDIRAREDGDKLYFILYCRVYLEKEFYGGVSKIDFPAQFQINPDGSEYIPSWKK